MFEDFYGHEAVAAALDLMIRENRIPQTMLFSGAEGVGKATLARRFAARLLGDPGKIEKDDLSRPENAAYVAERERWTSEKRVQDPLVFGTHPDFLTFPPDGPLRQISIQQMRLLKERAQYGPLKGKRRVFLVDQIDRANEQAANSLLKILEEPPGYLVLVLTASNPYDLLPTIRSRAVPFHFPPLGVDQMRTYLENRGMDHIDRRIALAGGSPGTAVSIDLESYDKRRTAMLALLQVAAGREPFALWARHSEAIGASKPEKLDAYLKVLYLLIEDLLVLNECGSPTAALLRNIDLKKELTPLAQSVSFDWISLATRKIDEIAAFLRRNIQKTIALDAFVVDLRAKARSG